MHSAIPKAVVAAIELRHPHLGSILKADIGEAVELHLRGMVSGAKLEAVLARYGHTYYEGAALKKIQPFYDDVEALLDEARGITPLPGASPIVVEPALLSTLFGQPDATEPLVCKHCGRPIKRVYSGALRWRHCDDTEFCASTVAEPPGDAS